MSTNPNTTRSRFDAYRPSYAIEAADVRAALDTKKVEAQTRIGELKDLTTGEILPPYPVFVPKVEALQKTLVEYVELKLKEHKSSSKEKVEELNEMLRKFTEIFGALGKQIVKLNASDSDPSSTFVLKPARSMANAFTNAFTSLSGSRPSPIAIPSPTGRITRNNSALSPVDSPNVRNASIIEPNTRSQGRPSNTGSALSPVSPSNVRNATLVASPRSHPLVNVGSQTSSRRTTNNNS